MRGVLWLVACAVVVPVPVPEPPAPPKAKVEFRWLEAAPIPVTTEDIGIRTTCDPDLFYPHMKPVLTSADVAVAVLNEHDFSASGLPARQYSVDFQFTDAARKKLVAEAGDRPTMLLAIFVEGRYRGTGYFRKAHADRFKPTAGFLTSKAEAERIVDACKRPAAP